MRGWASCGTTEKAGKLQQYSGMNLPVCRCEVAVETNACKPKPSSKQQGGKRYTKAKDCPHANII